MEGRKSGGSSASAALKNLRQLLTTTPSRAKSSVNLNHSKVGASPPKLKRGKKNAKSLFNLMSIAGANANAHTNPHPNNTPTPPSNSPGEEEVPFPGEGPFSLSKSRSMYGLSERSRSGDEVTGSSTSSSKNLASRLLSNLRTKFLRGRGKENSKVKICDPSPFQEPRYSSAIQLASSASIGNMLEGMLGSRSRSESGSGSVSVSVSVGEGAEVSRRRLFTSPELASGLEPPGEESEAEDSEVFNEEEEDQKPRPNPNLLIPVGRGGVTRSVSPGGRLRCLTAELDDLWNYGWYWAGLSKEETEEKLKGQPDGAFIVRDSTSDHYLLALSFNCNGHILHTRIEYVNGYFGFYSSTIEETFPSVAQLIAHSMAYSELGVFCYSRARRPDDTRHAIRLTKAVSRFIEVKSLMYLSRYVIRQFVRMDHIPLLPLPPAIIAFVAEQRYIY